MVIGERAHANDIQVTELQKESERLILNETPY